MDIYNLKAFIRQRIWVSVLCATVTALCLCWASHLFVKTYAAERVHSRSAYIYVGKDDEFDGKSPNTYCLLNNINLKESADSPPIEADVFMQGDRAEYYGNYLDGFSKEGGRLSGGECAVSADFARKYRLREGGTLIVHPHGDKDRTVTVKTILPEYFGLNRADLYGSGGAVVLGFIDVIAQDVSGYTVYRFVDGTQNASFGSTEAPVHKSDLLLEIRVNYDIAAGVSVFAVLFSLVLSDGMFGGDERRDACIFYRETAKSGSQLAYIAVYSLYKHLLPFTIAIAAGGIVTAILNAVSHVAFGYKTVIFLIVFGIIALSVCTLFSIFINEVYARSKR